MDKQTTKVPKVTIESIEFCKPFREGVITRDEITNNPLLTLEQLKNASTGDARFELNVITFIPESLDVCLPPSSYQSIPLQIALPKITIDNRICFGYLGVDTNTQRNHFDIKYEEKKPIPTEETEDYMLVYFRVIYAVSNMQEEERIIVTENYDPKIGDQPKTKRGTKTTIRIIEVEND